MLNVITVIAAFFYLATASYQGAYLLNKIELPPKHSQLLALGFAAVIAHGIVVYTTVYMHHAIDIGFFRVSSLIFWFIALIALLMTLRRPSDNLIVVIFPLAAVAMLVSALTPAARELFTIANPGMAVHILTSILAYSVLSIAALQALVLALQERLLRHHQVRGILRALPPLQTMEAMLFEMILVGVIMLTVSIVSGALFIENLFAQHLVHKTVFSLLAWLLFTTLLWGRYQLGWRSRTAVVWTLTGFVMLMLGYFGSKFVLEIILERH